MTTNNYAQIVNELQKFNIFMSQQTVADILWNTRKLDFYDLRNMQINVIAIAFMVFEGKTIDHDSTDFIQVLEDLQPDYRMSGYNGHSVIWNAMDIFGTYYDLEDESDVQTFIDDIRFTLIENGEPCNTEYYAA